LRTTFMAQIFGDYNNHLPVCQEYLTLVLTPNSVPLQQRWHNNGLSADFMADYLAAFFPRRQATASKINSKVEVKSAVSFIANELLENAMKFNDWTSDYPISITLQLQAEGLVFLAKNSIPRESTENFQAYIQVLTASDPKQLLLRQLEKNVENENSTSSGLGLLTMLSDYLAKIGWKFETAPEDPKIMTVITMVYLMM
jgi:hypothetical protein